MTRVQQITDLLEQAIEDGDSNRAVEVIGLYDLTRGERSAICRQLAAVPEPEEVTLIFDRWDRARTVSDAWRDDRTIS